MGRDCSSKPGVALRCYFNPLSPCGERHVSATSAGRCPRFQPTLPVWGETIKLEFLIHHRSISTHSPRVGRDIKALESMNLHSQFQPTLPVWGETRHNRHYHLRICISTHSPRVGRDASDLSQKLNETNFNPLSPCGERLAFSGVAHGSNVFQPTLPVWGETAHQSPGQSGGIISTHSPRVGRDKQSSCHPGTLPNFNPLSPCGERHIAGAGKGLLSQISTHSPRVGRDTAYLLISY